MTEDKIRKIVIFLFKIILVYLVVHILLLVYREWPEKRDKEAEEYFLKQLHMQIGDADSLDTNLSDFTKFDWNQVCFEYDKHGKIFYIFFRKKDGFIKDTEYYLNLTGFISIDDSHTHSISEKVPMQNKNKKIVGVETTCLDKGNEFTIRRARENKDKYFFNYRVITLEEYIKKKEKRNAK